jgi:hypothetical protein
MGKEINFNPYTHNVLDYLGQPLVCIETGEMVMVNQTIYGKFVIYVSGKLTETVDSNLVASSILNRIGCKLAE